MFDRIFELVWLGGLITGSVIRTVSTLRIKHWWQNKEAIAEEKSTQLGKMLISLTSVGMFIMPLIYVLTTWLDFADYFLPSWAGWAGAALFALALYVLWRSHADLKDNFSPELQLSQEHALITDGVFQYIRHPMYVAHLLWALAQPLLLQNWLAGFSMLVFLIPLYIQRIPQEEEMMLERFGSEYRSYMEQTGRFIPRFSS